MLYVGNKFVCIFLITVCVIKVLCAIMWGMPLCAKCVAFLYSTMSCMKGIGINVVNSNTVSLMYLVNIGSCFIMQLYDVHSVFFQ